MSKIIRSALSLVACSVICVMTGQAEAQTIYAQTGFNDQTGINSNATPGSPYVIGQTAAGHGTGESGWNGTWFTQDGGAQGGEGNALVKAGSAFEGDAGMQITPASLGSTLARRNLAEDRFDRFIMEYSLNFGSAGDLQALMLQNSAPQGQNPNGPRWKIGGAVGSRHFEVFDGAANGTGQWEDTGIAQKPGEWQHVVVDINVPTLTFKLSVDGVLFNAPDSLGFEGPTPVLNQVIFFDSASGSIDSVVIRGLDPADQWRIADVNNDGHVTVGDLGILATHFNQTIAGGKSVGDLNLDGSVTVGDLGILATYFGQPAAAGASTESFADALKQFPNLPANAVPEPSALALIALAVPAALRRHRR